MSLAELENDPHPALARMRPVSWVPELGAWLVTGYDLAVAVLRDPVTFTVDDPRFATARVVGPSMLSLDGEAHARHRAAFTGGFRAARVRDRLAAFVEAETGRLVDGIAPDGAADLRLAVAAPLAVAVMAHALDLVNEPVILDWYAAIVAATSAYASGEPDREVLAAGAAAFGELSARLRAAARPGSLLADAIGTSRGAGQDEGAGTRGADPADDAIGPSRGAGQNEDAIITALGARPGAGLPADTVAPARGTPPGAGLAGGLTEDEAVSNAAVLMFGGIETTEGMIANVMLHLLTNPGQLALVRADPGLAGAAVEESLRLEPAAAVVDRYATAGTELNGLPVKAGDQVTVSIAGANRDPAVFPDPDRFDVRRANAARHLAFAHGPHFCLGAHLARLEARVAVETMLARLPGLRLDSGRLDDGWPDSGRPDSGRPDGGRPDDGGPPRPRGLVFRKPARLPAYWDAYPDGTWVA